MAAFNICPDSAQAFPFRERFSSHDTLYQPYHHYRSSFFLFRLYMTVNGQPSVVSASPSGNLVLECPDQPATSISFPDLFHHVERILRDFGVSKVTNCWCDEAPLFEVLFTSQNDLRQFVHHTATICFRLSSVVSKMLAAKYQYWHTTDLTERPIECRLEEADRHSVSTDSSFDESKVTIMADLFLMTPGVDSESLLIEPVTIENYQSCLDKWNVHTRFEFRDVFRRYQLDPTQFSGQSGKVLWSCTLRTVTQAP